MPRKSPSSIRIDANLRCDRIYPVEGTKKNVAGLKTVGIKLNSKQAIDLARVLLAASQRWEYLDLTAYRLEQRKADGTYHITVTTME